MEEETKSLQETWDVVWFKFVAWVELVPIVLPADKRELLEQAVRRPPMLALVFVNHALHMAKPEDGDEAKMTAWEEVENRRKIIRARDPTPVIDRAVTLLSLEELEVPSEVSDKFFDFANVMLDIIIAMNE